MNPMDLTSSVQLAFRVGQELLRFEFFAASNYISHEPGESRPMIIDQCYNELLRAHTDCIEAVGEDAYGSRLLATSLKQFWQEYKNSFGAQEHNELAKERNDGVDTELEHSFMLRQSPFSQKLWRRVSADASQFGRSADPVVRAGFQLGRYLGYGNWAVLPGEFDNRAAVVSELKLSISLIEENFAGQAPRPVSWYLRSTRVGRLVCRWVKELRHPSNSTPSFLGLVLDGRIVRRFGYGTEVRLRPLLARLFFRLLRSADQPCTVEQLRHAWPDEAPAPVNLQQAISNLRQALKPLDVSLPPETNEAYQLCEIKGVISEPLS
jgi:hypothetical protein